MRWLLLIGICGAIGCAAEPHDKAAELHDKTAEPHDKTERQVLQWLAKGGYRVYVSNHGVPLTFNFNTWIAQGRKIPNIEPMLRRMLDESDSRVDLPMVAGALGGLGNAQSVPVLIDSLSRPDCRLRTAAADALGQLRDARAVEPLATRFRVDDDQGVRTGVLSALAAIGDEPALRHLKSAVNDANPDVSQFARDLVPFSAPSISSKDWPFLVKADPPYYRHDVDLTSTWSLCAPVRPSEFAAHPRVRNVGLVGVLVQRNDELEKKRGQGKRRNKPAWDWE